MEYHKLRIYNPPSFVWGGGSCLSGGRELTQIVTLSPVGYRTLVVASEENIRWSYRYGALITILRDKHVWFLSAKLDMLGWEPRTSQDFLLKPFFANSLTTQIQMPHIAGEHLVVLLLSNDKSFAEMLASLTDGPKSKRELMSAIKEWSTKHPGSQERVYCAFGSVTFEASFNDARPGSGMLNALMDQLNEMTNFGHEPNQGLNLIREFCRASDT